MPSLISIGLGPTIRRETSVNLLLTNAFYPNDSSMALFTLKCIGSALPQRPYVLSGIFTTFVATLFTCLEGSGPSMSVSSLTRGQ